MQSVFFFATQTIAFNERITSNKYYGCLKEDDLDLMVETANSKNQEALATLLLSRKCMSLKVGAEVDVVESGFSSDKIKIIPRGSTQILYTFKEAIMK